MFAVIAGAELVIEFCFGCDQPIEMGEILITQSAKAACDRFRIRDFGANQPQRVHERKADKLPPLLAKILKLKFVCMFLTKADCLVADEKLRRSSRT